LWSRRSTTGSGAGWTPNLGNPKACLLYGGILAAIIALTVVRAVAAG